MFDARFDRLVRYLSTNKLDAVIFDFDGVIVDSEDHWGGVESPYLKKYIAKWSDEDYDQLTGMGLAEVHHLLVAKYKYPLSQEQYFRDYEILALTLYDQVTQPIPGLGEILHYLDERDIKTGIASSSKRSWIDLALKRHSLDGYFLNISSSHDEDIAKGKPAPDVYLKAIDILDTSVGRSIAIEDSSSGVKAAKSAGIFCIGLNINGNNSQDLSQADCIVVSYGELVDVLRQFLD